MSFPIKNNVRLNTGMQRRAVKIIFKMVVVLILPSLSLVYAVIVLLKEYL
jgi:hypothetical protein